VTFEYEIRMIKEHNDFIIGPPRGDVPGNGEAVIEIIYEPRSASTATCEVEFKLSEFDFQPMISKVIASATH